MDIERISYLQYSAEKLARASCWEPGQYENLVQKYIYARLDMIVQTESSRCTVQWQQTDSFGGWPRVVSSHNSLKNLQVKPCFIEGTKV